MRLECPGAVLQSTLKNAPLRCCCKGMMEEYSVGLEISIATRSLAGSPFARLGFPRFLAHIDRVSFLSTGDAKASLLHRGCWDIVPIEKKSTHCVHPIGPHSWLLIQFCGSLCICRLHPLDSNMLRTYLKPADELLSSELPCNAPVLAQKQQRLNSPTGGVLHVHT